MNIEPVADHILNLLTLFIFLVSFLKGWLERVPVIEWLWPRAWDRWRASRRATTDDDSVALEHLMTELGPLQETMEEILTRLDGLQSGLRAVDDRFSRLEGWLMNHEDVLSMNKHQQQRVDALLTSLGGAVTTLQARDDAPSTGCERCHVLEEAIHRFLGRARAIHDRKA